MQRFSHRHLPALLLAVLLAGCAAPPPPQAVVQVFTPAALVAPGATYRHERLPSQAGRPDLPALEGAVDAALARVGLRRDDVNPRLSIQTTVSQDALAYAPASPSWMSVGLGGSSGGWSGGGVGVGFSFPIGGVAPSYPSLRVDVIMRDLANGQVVFQSQAMSNSGASPGLLLDAALGGFPNTPPGIHAVPLPLPPR